MAEYIDKEEVLSGLRQKYDDFFAKNPEFYRGFKTACKYVRDFDTSGYCAEWNPKKNKTLKNGWIDVHDQKPEVGTEIIGMYAYGNIARFVVESESSYRMDCTAEYCKVDYWLPMPELPEECR